MVNYPSGSDILATRYNKNNQLTLESYFMTAAISSTTGNAQKNYTSFCRFLVITPISIESSQFLRMWMMFNHPKTNSTKFLHYRLNM